ncbi:DUF1697 domain-containing protein [Lacisediminihabitans profunda]|uniref:DUF1697 domain-containing protein n=1 Tax=Lacisediminihabitans profunda TaxID=2594790 RepID=A0A5C8UP46_9MICO|nr:DUF1697 domain-containing protein [Lacisediminihabitans profunda]TXN29671.1 DUF1697 domain-containing protein [Lacisediminihabitans profunda]
MVRYVALLRGINVGTAKAISMADLAEVFAGLGFSDVRTVLRSGNVVFSSSVPLGAHAARSIEAAVRSSTGVQSSVLLLAGGEFAEIAGANPLLAVATDGSKSFVTFAGSMPDRLDVPEAAAIAPELLAVGERAIYQWMPNGSQQTRVPKSFWKQFDAPVTARNWNTVSKLLDLLGE